MIRVWILKWRHNEYLMQEEFRNWQLMMHTYWQLDAQGKNPVICDAAFLENL